MIFISVIFLFFIFIFFYNIKELKIKQNIKYDSKKISVIIPARNEEINLPSLLSSLKTQSQDVGEIIIVNDGSRDRTDSIATSFNVKIININVHPNDWKGKTYACYIGAQNSTYDILLFLDADLILKYDAIEKLISEFNDKEVLSVQPYHYTKKAYEKFSLFFNVISVAAVGVCLPGKDKSIGLFGPVIMVDKNLYFSFGGHEIVKDEVVEDYKLGNLLRAKNIRCNLFLGINSISYRMYRGGLMDLIWGWSKNFASRSFWHTITLFISCIFMGFSILFNSY